MTQAPSLTGPHPLPATLDARRQHLRRHLGPQCPLTPPAAPAATGARPSGDRSRRPDGEPWRGRGHRAALGHRAAGIPGQRSLPRPRPLRPPPPSSPRLPAPAAFGSAASRHEKPQAPPPSLLRAPEPSARHSGLEGGPRRGDRDQPGPEPSMCSLQAGTERAGRFGFSRALEELWLDQRFPNCAAL